MTEFNSRICRVLAPSPGLPSVPSEHLHSSAPLPALSTVERKDKASWGCLAGDRGRRGGGSQVPMLALKSISCCLIRSHPHLPRQDPLRLMDTGDPTVAPSHPTLDFRGIKHLNSFSKASEPHHREHPAS